MTFYGTPWSLNVKTDKKNQVLLLFFFFFEFASEERIFKLMLLYYEECGIFKGFGCPTHEEKYDRCTNFQFPRQSAKLSNVSNKKNVLVLAAGFHSVAIEYLIVYNNGRSKQVGKNEMHIQSLPGSRDNAENL